MKTIDQGASDGEIKEVIGRRADGRLRALDVGCVGRLALLSLLASGWLVLPACLEQGEGRIRAEWTGRDGESNQWVLGRIEPELGFCGNLTVSQEVDGVDVTGVFSADRLTLDDLVVEGEDCESNTTISVSSSATRRDSVVWKECSGSTTDEEGTVLGPGRFRWVYNGSLSTACKGELIGAEVHRLRGGRWSTVSRTGARGEFWADGGPGLYCTEGGGYRSEATGEWVDMGPNRLCALALPSDPWGVPALTPMSTLEVGVTACLVDQGLTVDDAREEASTRVIRWFGLGGLDPYWRFATPVDPSQPWRQASPTGRLVGLASAGFEQLAWDRHSTDGASLIRRLAEELTPACNLPRPGGFRNELEDATKRFSEGPRNISLP